MYKTETSAQVAKVLTEFFREEQGNRITSNNMQSLLVKVQQVFEQNMEARKDVKDKEGK